MSVESNFENLTSLFKKVCSNLEANAEVDLKRIESDCREEFNYSRKYLENFKELITVISKTCSELVDSSDILKDAMKRTHQDNVLNLPHEFQLDVMNCVSELYNMPPLEKYRADEKIVNEKNEKIISDIIKECEKNIHTVNDVECAVVEAKQNF